jgi:hypothetical protein
MKTISAEEKDELFINATRAVGELMAAALNDIPATTHKKIALSLNYGGTLTVMYSILETPRFIGLLMEGPEATPTKLFEIVPSSGTLPQDMVSH